MSYLSEAMFAGNRELSETEVNDGKFNFTFETKDGETYDIKASNSDDAITNFHKAYPTVQDDDIIALYDESDIHYCPVSGEELDEQKLNETLTEEITDEELIDYFVSMGYEKGAGSSNSYSGDDYFEGLDDFKDPYLVAEDPEFEIQFNFDEGGAYEFFDEISEESDELLSRLVKVGREYVAPSRLLNRFKSLLDPSGLSDLSYQKSTTVNGAPLSLIYSGGGGPTYYVYDRSRLEDYFEDGELDEQKLNELFNANISPNFSPNINLDLSGGGAASLLGLLGESSEHGFSVGDKVYYVDDEPKVPGEIVEIYDDGTCLVIVDGDPDDQVVVNMDSIDYWDDSLGECTMTEDTIRKSNGKWTNRGDDGKEHGEFDTKAEADAQRKAMYANGYKGESLYSSPHRYKRSEIEAVRDAALAVKDNSDLYNVYDMLLGIDAMPIYRNYCDLEDQNRFSYAELGKMIADDLDQELNDSNNDLILQNESKHKVTESLQVGDKIRIEFMEGEPQYTGREGVVTAISKDPWGDTAIYGTWGGCSLYPSAGDSYTILSKDGDLDEGKKLCEYEDDPYENYDDDTAYIDYDEAEFARDDLGFDKEDIGKYTWGNVRSKYESKKKIKESTDDGIRVRQLRNNIEEICDEYLNGIYDGYNEPFSSTDALVDYVYRQVFDLKSDGGGYTRYGTGICRDLKYLGKDFIVSEIIKYGQDILAEDVVTTTSV